MQFCAQVQARGTWPIDRGTWAIARGTLPVGAGVALDWAALERVLATKGLGAKFPNVELNFSKRPSFELWSLMSTYYQRQRLKELAKRYEQCHPPLWRRIFLGIKKWIIHLSYREIP